MTDPQKLINNGADPHWSQFWSLDPTVVFLNHGSFGACPLPVLAAQQQLRQQMEHQPLRFMAQELEPLLDDARSKLAAFVGADPQELAFVPNATTGVNTILRSLCLPNHPLHLRPGDELLTTNHEYNACRNALNFVAAASGAKIVVADVPFPLTGPEQIIEAVVQQISPRTRLALLDHVTSQTGLIFPIAQLVRELAERGVDTLIDGAHAPGMVPLNLHEIGAAYYTGNCHKWLCAPKGAAFLYVRSDRQSEIRPLTISHGANSPRSDRSRFQLEFDWTGTDDPTAWLCIPVAIRWMGSLLEGWPELMAYNHAKVLEGRRILCEALQIPQPCPDEMVGSMASLPLPIHLPDALYSLLMEQFQIEVPIVPWSQPERLIRISAQVYNTPAQYEYLAKALKQLSQDTAKC